jgi:hypothetical protein
MKTKDEKFKKKVSQAIRDTYRMGHKCVNDQNFCVYLNHKTGDRCLVGSMIPKHYYSKGMEGVAVPMGLPPYETEIMDMVNSMKYQKLYDALTASFGFELDHTQLGILRSLQACHDNMISTRVIFTEAFVDRVSKQKMIPPWCAEVVRECHNG